MFLFKRKPVTIAGDKHKTATRAFDSGRNAIKINVTSIPPPNKYKSNGLNQPNINLPLLVLAGIR